jgi:putative membrane protein
LGIITALVRPILKLLFTIPNLATFDLLSGIFTFMIAVVCFSIAAWLVEGFRLRYGIWSAVLGAFALTIINSFIYKLLSL